MSISFPQRLPRSRTYLSTLLATFPQDQGPSSPRPGPFSNPLQSTSPAIRSLLLTLHVLFPNELLPALDLLDRRFVTRHILHSPSPDDPTVTEGVEGIAGQGRPTEDRLPIDDGNRIVQQKASTVYYVRSSQQPRSRISSSISGRTYDALAGLGQSYEVRLRAWNCNCPAFAFGSAACVSQELHPGLGTDDAGRTEEGMQRIDGVESGKTGEGGKFGGLMRGEAEMPVCKHLLACYLAESWSRFDEQVDESIVSKEEMSGWAAGWGGWIERRGGI